MTVAFGSISSAARNTYASTIVVNVPAGTANGDLLLLFATNSVPNLYTAPSGWTLLEHAFDSGKAIGDLWYRIASSEPASYTLAEVTGVGHLLATATIVRYTGTSGVRSHTQVKSTTTGATSPPAAAPSGVIGTDMVVHFFGEVNQATVSGANTFTGPASGFTTRGSISTSTATADYQCGAVVADALGSSATPTATCSHASAWWEIASVALIAAGGLSTGPALATASAFAPATIVTTYAPPTGGLGAGPLGSEPLGGQPGLAQGRATAGAGQPSSAPAVAAVATAAATAGVGRPTSIANYGTAAAYAIAARALDLDLDLLLDEATAEADRMPVFGLQADWDGDGSFDHPLSELTPVVTEFSVERELTDMGEALGLIQGAAAAKLTATLAGSWRPTAATPSRPWPDGPVLAAFALMPEDGFIPGTYATADYTFGLEWSATDEVQVDAIRYWRQNSTVTALEAGIFDVETQLEVPGTHVLIGAATPAPGYHLVPLLEPFYPVVGKRYKVAVRFSTFHQAVGYFVGSGPGHITTDYGRLRRYSAADATFGLQSTYLGFAGFGYPAHDLEGDGKCYGIDIVASVRATLPGNPTAADTDPAKAFAPYRPDADLAGYAVIGKGLSLTAGMQTARGPVAIPKFTGTVTALEPSSAGRAVVLEGLDPVDRLRRPIYQKAWGQSVRQVMKPDEVGRRRRQKYNSQWFIDRALRTGGFFASPPPGSNSGVLLSTTQHGAPLPEIGYKHEADTRVAPGTSELPHYVALDHPHGMMYPNPAQKREDSYYAPTWAPLTAGNGYAMSMLLRCTPAPPPVEVGVDLINIIPCFRRDTLPYIEFSLNSGAPKLAVYGGNGVTTATYTMPGWTNPTDETWRFIGAHVKFTGTHVIFSLYRGDTRQTYFSIVPMTTAQVMGSAVLDPHAWIGTQHRWAFTNLTIWSVPDAPAQWVGDGWQSTAHLDPGANWFTGNYDVRGTQAYDLIKEVTAAEYAGFFFDEDGIPHWRTRTAAPHPRRVELITAERSLADLMARVDEQSVRNEIAYDCERTEVQPPEPIWELEDPEGLDMLAGATRDLIIPLPDNCAHTFGFLPGEVQGTFWPTNLWNDRWPDAWAFQTEPNYCVINPNLPGQDMIPAVGQNIAFNVVMLDSFTIKVTIYNNTGFPVRFATSTADGNAPEPAFHWPGWKVDASWHELGSLTSPTSIERYGSRVLDLGGAPWRQDVASSVSIGYSLMDWTSRPKPVMSEIDVPHDPRRKLYDQAVVTDPNGLGSVTGKLAAIRSRFSGTEGARDSLLVRPDTPPPGW